MNSETIQDVYFLIFFFFIIKNFKILKSYDWFGKKVFNENIKNF